MPNQDLPTNQTLNNPSNDTSGDVLGTTPPISPTTTINDTPSSTISDIKPLTSASLPTDTITESPPPPIVIPAEVGNAPASMQPLSDVPTTGTDQSLPPLNVSPVVVTGGSGGGDLGKKVGRKGLIATVLGLFLLVSGVGAGLYLTGQNQDIREEAAVSDQVAEPTATATTTAASSLFECKEIRAYKVTGDITDPTNWTKLLAADLKVLNKSDIIYITVVGGSTDTVTANGGFDKAEFTINSAAPIESTNIKPKAISDTSAVEYYYKYTIPTSAGTFVIKARLHHIMAGWM